MKKIAIVKNKFSLFGGLEKQTGYICKEFLKKNYDIHIITFDSKKSKINENEKLIFHYIKKPFFLSFLKIFLFDFFAKKILKNINPDIILALDRTTYQTHIRAGNGIHREYLNQRVRFSPFNKIRKLLFLINPLHLIILQKEKRAFLDKKKLKKILVNSHMVKKELIKYFPNVDQEKIHVFHNPIDLSKTRTFFDKKFKVKNQLKESLGLSIDKKIFIFVGHGYKRKGLDIILSALSNLKNKNFYLFVIGKDKNLSKYKKLVIKLNLENQIIFLGKKEDIYKYYQMADFSIIPSIYDPFANVTLEALSMGCFAVSSNTNGGKEIINTENGIILNDLLDKNLLKDVFEDLIENIEITPSKAQNIRNTIKHLDTKIVLDTLINEIIKDD